MIFFILITGTVVGILPGVLRLDKMLSIPNILLGLAGALIGAFLGFGDAQLLSDYPFLNEKTLSVVVSIALVFIKVSVAKKNIKP